MKTVMWIGKTIFTIVLAIVAFGLLFKELKEPVDSRRLQRKIFTILDSEDVQIRDRIVSANDTSYSTHLGGHVASREDAIHIKHVLIDRLSPDELKHLSFLLFVDDKASSKSQSILWEDIP
ncbi:hypothetical protein JXA32_10835 [Candidatus Sumerlaeota bacterium]|nr:hypothetical protein [Candidatus Sumerlaeota bacterium]